jgi:hypothetical protein
MNSRITSWFMTIYDDHEFFCEVAKLMGQILPLLCPYGEVRPAFSHSQFAVRRFSIPPWCMLDNWFIFTKRIISIPNGSRDIQTNVGE